MAFASGKKLTLSVGLLVMPVHPLFYLRTVSHAIDRSRPRDCDLAIFLIAEYKAMGMLDCHSLKAVEPRYF